MEPRRPKTVEFRPNPVRIVLVYTLAGGIWIFFSDLALSFFFKDMSTITQFQTFKGWLFIGITSLLLYLFLKKDFDAIHESQHSLRDSEERYRVIAETASDAIITIDENSIIQFINPSVGKIFGYSPGELLGSEITLLMPERLRKAHRDSIKRYIATGRRDIQWTASELPGLHKNGKEVPLEISYSEFISDGKHFFTGIVRDISERRDAQKEKEYNEMLERFNHDMDSLISERTMNLLAMTLADRVRTPATIIGGIAKRSAGKQDIPGKVKEDISVIIDEADKLEMIVRDFQAFLKSRQSLFHYEDINEIVSEIILIIGRQASEKNLTLSVELAERPLKINVQRDLLRMAIFNILKNSIENTPEGGRITIKSARDDNVILSFSDTGYGIPQEELDRIFDPFYRTKAKKYGIGLPLIKQIVLEHMGKITVESEPGKETTFRMIFPPRWEIKTRQSDGPAVFTDKSDYE